MFLILIISLVIAVICICIPGHLMTNVIRAKGYDPSTIHPYLLTIFLGLFGVLYMMALPDLIERQQHDSILRALRESNAENVNSTYSTQKHDYNESITHSNANTFCASCGNKLAPNSSFCDRCGKPQ